MPTASAICKTEELQTPVRKTDEASLQELLVLCLFFPMRLFLFVVCAESEIPCDSIIPTDRSGVKAFYKSMNAFRNERAEKCGHPPKVGARKNFIRILWHQNSTTGETAAYRRPHLYPMRR